MTGLARGGLIAAPLGQACRALCAQAELWATNITLRKGEKALEVEFNTGERFTYPAEYLRVESPAAGNLDARDARGQLKVVHGRRHVGIIGIQPVGSYAVRLEFDDMHSSGIYSWQYLHDLGTQKLSRMRRYLRTLHQRGLSRDPPQRPRGKQQQQPQAQQQEQQPQGGGKGSSGSDSSSRSEPG